MTLPQRQPALVFFRLLKLFKILKENLNIKPVDVILMKLDLHNSKHV